MKGTKQQEISHLRLCFAHKPFSWLKQKSKLKLTSILLCPQSLHFSQRLVNTVEVWVCMLGKVGSCTLFSWTVRPETT